MRKSLQAIITVLLIICGIQAGNCQFSYINPMPGSQYHNPQMNLTIRNESLIDEASLVASDFIEIHGSLSGAHQCSARLSDDGKTIVIKPHSVFQYGETVFVNIHPVLKNVNGEVIDGSSFSFRIRDAITPEKQELRERINLDQFIESFGYDPTAKDDLEDTDPPLPPFTINVNNNAAPGKIFYNNQNELVVPDTTCYITIIENDGTVDWSQYTWFNGHDFKLNYNGYLSYFKYFGSHWMVLDSNYNIIDSIQCKNGYELETNGHDVTMYPDGHIFLIAYNKQTIDMTPYGGQPDAEVTGLIIQELDAEKDVVFEWRSWDHFQFTDAAATISLTNAVVDYCHGNSVERDNDGNIIISCRNFSEVTKINHQTGNIMWRMGGENNQFTFVGDNIPEHFVFQHDARRIANGNLTMYNNGNYLPEQKSSAKEYQVDEVNKIATLIWFYEHPDINGEHVYGRASGSAQRLSNGNTMIGWGTTFNGLGMPTATEVNKNKIIKWEMTLDEEGQKCYRVHKYQWDPCSRITGYTMHAAPKPTKATLAWGKATGANSYKLRYRALGTANWSNINTPLAKVKLTGLTPNTSYEWQVKTHCSNNPPITSALSVRDTFTTPPLKMVNETINSPEMFSVYPVPASDRITIKMWGTGDGSIMIFDVVGTKMYERNIKALENGTLEIDVQQWPAGIYLVEMNDGVNSHVKKVRKE